MSQDKAAHAGHSIKPYIAVFAVLMVLTVVTVAVSKIDMSRPVALFVGLAIAAIKASLVALFFMHLKGERTLIWSLLGLCAIFVVALFALPWVDFRDNAIVLGRTQRDPVSAGNHGEAHGGQTGDEHGAKADPLAPPTEKEKKKSPAAKKKAPAH